MSTSNSLSLLAQDYDGSDSNPEEDDKDTGPSHKRPKLALALPPAFAKEDKDNIKEEDEVVHDNPDDHQGRVRSFEHVKGNWATYVYISLRAIESELKALAKIVRETCNDLLELKPVEDPHVSLSKVGALKYAQIPEFASSLRKALQTFPKQLLTFHSFRAFVNENKSRTFLGLKVRADSLNEIVDTLDIVLEDEFNMDPFYESRSFHVSLLWALGDQEKVLNSRIEAIRGKWNSFLACEEGVRIKKGIQVSEIQGKTGNKIFNFALT